MKKSIKSLCVIVMAVFFLIGCGTNKDNKKNEGKVKLDPENPISIRVWHYYNGSQQAAFDELVNEFNSTKGKELGINVEGISQGTVSDLAKTVSDSIDGKVGVDKLPDIFSSYADTAYYAQQKGKLVDLSEYFSKEELEKYVDSYIEEGYLKNDKALYLFPVAKTTESLMINKTDWEPFAKQTGSSLDELKTIEGVVKVAKRYYEWTDSLTPDVADDGKAFYGIDSMSNYFIIGMKQMGVDLFDVKDGKLTIRADKEKIRRLWDNYYVPYVNGYFASFGKFRSDDIKTGDILAYTGSVSSSMYFPDQVITDDGTRDIDCIVMQPPVLEGGEHICVQQGAGMAVTKSDERHEYAACEFLKWFTRKENNLRFVCESAYLPVRKDSNSVEALDEIIKDKDLKVNDKAYQCLDSILSSYDLTSFYTPKCFENGYTARKILDYDLSDKAAEDKAKVDEMAAGGMSKAEAEARFTTDEAFEQWYEQWNTKLENAAFQNN